jgi:hypothetical protein
MTALLEVVVHAAALLAYSLGCLALGMALLRLLLGASARVGDLPVPAHLGSAFILGQGVLSQTLILGGLVVDFTAVLVWGAIGVSLALGVRELRTVGGGLRIVARDAVGGWRSETLGWKVIAVACSVLLVLWACAAVVYPPMGDGEAFYFVYAKFIAAGNRLVPLIGNYEPFSTIGLLGELHFAALMTIAGPASAKLFVWLTACAACVALMETGRTCGIGVRGRLVLLVLLLTSSTFVLYIPDGKVDLFAAALGLSAYYWALPVRQVPAVAAARVCGVLAGLACVAKFSYVPVLVPSLLVMLLARRDGVSGFGMRAGLLATAAMTAAMAGLPHLIKNAVFFGEPLAPFVTASSDRAWLNQVWFDAQATAWIVKTYPLALVFGRYPMQGGTLSFAWLALAPLAFLLPRVRYSLRTPLGVAVAAGLIGLLVWVALRPSVIAPRYILAPLLLLFLPVGKAVEDLSIARTRILSYSALACLLIACAVNVITHRTAANDLIRLASKGLTPCHRASPHCADLIHINALAESGERALVLSYYTYWLRSDLLLCRNTYREGVAVKRAADAEEAWVSIATSGLTLLLVDQSSHGAEFERLWTQRPAWVETTEIYRGSAVVAYRIANHDSTYRPRVSCVKRPGGHWEVLAEPASRIAR